MKKNIVLMFFTIISLGIYSCTQVLDVSVPNEDDRLVVEGLVTTQLIPYQVKLSKTVALGKGSAYPLVNDAEVIISDNVGNRDTLKLVAPGVYKTKVPKAAVVGRTYFLTIKQGGLTYYGQDKLLQVCPIDSFYVEYKKAGSGIGIKKDGYYLFFNFTDPYAEKNYYQDKVFKNGEAVLGQSELDVYDDLFLLHPQVKGSRLPGRYATGDKVKLEFYSLSQEAYTFYGGLINQLQNDGGFFSTPPANAASNMSNGALGFFQVSDLKVDSLVVP